MSKDVKIFRLVVALPGDTQAERDVVQTVADELNLGVVARSLRARLAR
jgi:hypothetical protein